MFEQIKSKLQSPLAQDIKSGLVQGAAMIAVVVAVKAGRYIVVEGTKSLIEEIKTRNTEG